MARRIRASYYLLGALLGRFGEASRGHARRLQLRRAAHRPARQGLPGHGRRGDGEGGFVHAAAEGGRLSRCQRLSGCGIRGRHHEHHDGRRAGRGHHHHRKRRQGATHRGSGQLPQLHGRRHQGRRYRLPSSINGRGAPQRRHLLHHPRPDRGGYLYGRCGRHRRTAADPQHHSQAHGLHLRQTAWKWASRWRSRTTPC